MPRTNKRELTDPAQPQIELLIMTARYGSGLPLNQAKAEIACLVTLGLHWSTYDPQYPLNEYKMLTTNEVVDGACSLLDGMRPSTVRSGLERLCDKGLAKRFGEGKAKWCAVGRAFRVFDQRRAAELEEKRDLARSLLDGLKAKSGAAALAATVRPDGCLMLTPSGVDALHRWLVNL